LLQRSAARFFVEPEDRALADISDAQGVGGRRERNLSKPEMPVFKETKATRNEESQKSNEQGIACE
jgi:hypothetical protein